MPRIKNVSPFGDLEVPALKITVASGESVEVSQEAYDALIQQPLHWASGDKVPVTPPSDSPTSPDK